MADEELLIEFICRYIEFKISEEDFESGLKNLVRPDAAQTRAFYVNSFDLAVTNKNETVQKILNVIVSTDIDTEKGISDAGVDNAHLEKCMEILYSYLIEDRSAS